MKELIFVSLVVFGLFMARLLLSVVGIVTMLFCDYTEY
jgi:hypothetical protein